MELTRDEKLVFLKALQKKVENELKFLEGEAKDEVLRRFVEDGDSDRRPIFINGVRVCEIALAYSKPKVGIRPGHEWLAIEYLEGCGLVQKVPVKDWEDRFTMVNGKVVDQDTGEVCEWAEWTPAVATTAKINKFKPEEALQALGDKLSGVNLAGLLEG